MKVDKSIRKREREMYVETWRLKNASMEIAKQGKNFERSRKIQKEEDELYKKQQFFKNYIREMEKKR